MTFRVRFARAADKDLQRLYDFILEREACDLAVARRALEAIQNAFDILTHSPFTCRKATSNNSFLRELVIAFGGSGYVALFEIEDEKTVTVLAVRHQREDDYH